MIRTLLLISIVTLLAAFASGDEPARKAELQFLYRIQPTRAALLTSGPTPEEQAIVLEHFNYLKDLAARGVVILAGRTLNTDESSFGIVIFRAENEEAARRIMNGDPAVARGVMKATLFPYRVALMEGKPIP
ncbi:MAG TPA: YciI family protein [Terriglobales bacterium]|nr:YciI family protein [Terriglobales bacterium]